MAFLLKRCPETADAEAMTGALQANYSYGLEYGKPSAADPIPAIQMRRNRLGHQQEEQLQLEAPEVRGLPDSARSVSPKCYPNTRRLLAPDSRTTKLQNQLIAPNCELLQGCAAKCLHERALAKPAVACTQQLLHGGSTAPSTMQTHSTQHVAPQQTLLGSFSDQMDAATSVGPVLIPTAATANKPAIPQSSAFNYGLGERSCCALPEIPHPQQAPPQEQHQRQQMLFQIGQQPQFAQPAERDCPCADPDRMPDADDDGSVAMILLSMRHAVAEDDGAAQGDPAGAACDGNKGLQSVGDVDGLVNDGEPINNDGSKGGDCRRFGGNLYLQPEGGGEPPLADVELEELQVQEGMIDAGGGVYVTPSTAGPGISFRSLAGVQGGSELYSSLARTVRSKAERPSQSPNPRGLKRPRAAAVRSPPAFTPPAPQSPASTSDKAASLAAATTAAITAAAATGGLGSALPLAALLGRISPALLRTVLASLPQAAANVLAAALSGVAEGVPTAAAADNCQTGAGGSRAGSEASDSSAGAALPLHLAQTRSPLLPAVQVANAPAPLDADMYSTKAGETRVAAGPGPVSDGEDKASNQQPPKIGDGSTNWQPPPRPPRNHKGPLICANCGTTQTPLWRKDRISGSTVCNACGIYKQTHGFDRPVGGRSQAPQPLRRRTIQQRVLPSQQQQQQVLQQYQGAGLLNREGAIPSDGDDWQHHTPEETVVPASATGAAARPAQETPGGAPIPSSPVVLRQQTMTGVRRESADPGAGSAVAAAPQAGELAQGRKSLERVLAEEPHVGVELERGGALERPGSGRVSPAVSSRTLDRSPFMVAPRVFLLPDGSAVVATVSGADGDNIGSCIGGAGLLAADVMPPAVVRQDDGLTNLRAVLALAEGPAYGHQFLHRQPRQQWQERDPVNSRGDLGQEVRRDDVVVARARDPDAPTQPVAEAVAAGGPAGCWQQPGPALAADMGADPEPIQDQEQGADSGSSCCEVLGRPPEKEAAVGTALMPSLAPGAAWGDKLGGAGQAASQLSTRQVAPDEQLHTTKDQRLEDDEGINGAERQPSLRRDATSGGLAVGFARALEGQRQQQRNYQQQERLCESPGRDSVLQSVSLAPTQRPPREMVIHAQARPQAAVAVAAKGAACVRLPNGRLAYVPVLPYPQPHPHTLPFTYPHDDGEGPLVVPSQPQPSLKQQQQARLQYPCQLQERHSQEHGHRQVRRQGEDCKHGDGRAWKGNWARGNGATDQPEGPCKTRLPQSGEPSRCRATLVDLASDPEVGSTAAAGDGADTGLTFASRRPEAGGAEWQGVAVVAAGRDLAGTAGSGSARYDGERRSRNEDGDSHSAGRHGNATNAAVMARIQGAATAANAGRVQLIRYAAAADEYLTCRAAHRPNQQTQRYESFKQPVVEAPSSTGLLKHLLVALRQHQVAQRPQQQPQQTMVAPVEGSGCGAGAGDDRDVPSVRRYSAGCSSEGGAAASGDASAAGVLHSSGASGDVDIVLRRSALDTPWLGLGIGHQGPHRRQQQHPHLQPFHHAGYPVQPIPPSRGQVQVPHINYCQPYEQLDGDRDQDASHLRPHIHSYRAEHVKDRNDCQPLQHAPRYGMTLGRRWDANSGDGLVLEPDAGQPVLLVREGTAFQRQQAGPPSEYTLSAAVSGPAGMERCYLKVNPEHGLVFSGRTAALEQGAALPQASRQAAAGPVALARIQTPPLVHGCVPMQRVGMARNDGGPQDAETGVNRFGGGGGGGTGAGRGLGSNGGEGLYWVLQLDAGASNARRPAPSASGIRL